MRIGLTALLLMAGCEYRFDLRAETAYREGRFLEAEERLARHEGDVRALGARRQARYGLYRGLASQRLGDDRAAQRWLQFAQAIDKKAPSLEADERALLAASLRALSDAGLSARGQVVLRPAP